MLCDRKTLWTALAVFAVQLGAVAAPVGQVRVAHGSLEHRIVQPNDPSGTDWGEVDERGGVRYEFTNASDEVFADRTAPFGEWAEIPEGTRSISITCAVSRHLTSHPNNRGRTIETAVTFTINADLNDSGSIRETVQATNEHIHGNGEEGNRLLGALEGHVISIPAPQGDALAPPPGDGADPATGETDSSPRTTADLSLREVLAVLGGALGLIFLVTLGFALVRKKR